MTPLFVTGTDTGVGKTIVSSLLISALKHAKRRFHYWKPLQTGLDSDSLTVSELTGEKIEFQPFQQFEEPMAPLRAAEIHGAVIHENEIVKHWREISQKNDQKMHQKRSIGSAPNGGGDDPYWVIEGAGGLEVPIARPDRTMKSLAGALGARALVVAQARLGAINHAMLTLESAHLAGLLVSGLVWTGNEEPEIERFFESWEPAHRGGRLLQIRVPRIQGPINAAKISDLGPEIFPIATLDQLWDDFRHV